MHEFLEIPVAASAHAWEIDRMTVLTHWLMALLFDFPRVRRGSDRYLEKLVHLEAPSVGLFE